MKLNAIMIAVSFFTGLSAAHAQSNLSSLPYATQRAAQQFPVTLYTGKDCGNLCSDARSYLQKRGVPYTEKVVSTPEMVNELKKVANTAAIPVLLVGRAALNGFSESSWGSQLDAAGYPNNALPKSYQPQVIEGQSDKAPAQAEKRPAPNPNNDRVVIPSPPPPPLNAPPGFRF